MMPENTFKAIAQLYEQMDSTWDTIAREHAFQCNGCTDNCCTSLFFHHTFIEKAYFLSGFDTLDSTMQEKILDRAKTYCQKTFTADAPAQSLKILCPANEDGRCLLYDHRPMICRLHGVPHILKRPGAFPLSGNGCEAGSFDSSHPARLDRTPFYQQMAQIEMAFRKSTGLSGKIKLSIAQILMSQ